MRYTFHQPLLHCLYHGLVSGLYPSSRVSPGQKLLLLLQLVRGLDVELCVVSPLSRTMQTASNAFKDVPVPMAVWPIVTEFYADEVWNLNLAHFYSAIHS